MDLYVVLGIARGSSVADIKRAYRRLARRYHPDINPGDQEAAQRFRQILDAYETLIDADRRRRYDLGVREAEPAPTYGFEGFDFSARAQGPHASTFGDLFADVIAGRQARRTASGAERGADQYASLALSFEDAVHGTERAVTVTRRETCRHCRGSGAERTAPVRCPACQGGGTVRATRGHMVFSKSCPPCGGTGQQRPRPCDLCHGVGLETRAETIAVRVPAGIADGERVRIAGQGNAGTHGGTHGDLLIAVQVASHDLFRRDGDDLHLVVPVGIHEAALGARIDVPTLDGTTRLRVPPGTQSGQRFRLRERGVTSPRTGQRGDLVVEVRLAMPKLLDERSKELLREFGRIHGEGARAEWGGPARTPERGTA